MNPKAIKFLEEKGSPKIKTPVKNVMVGDTN